MKLSPLAAHEIWLCLFQGENSLYTRAKITPLIDTDSHDWNFVLVCLIEKMDHSRSVVI